MDMSCHVLPVGKLRLKVPWKNLYSAPVVAEVDGLYVLAGPAAGEGVWLTVWQSLCYTQ
jgi:hypothetical protein